MGYDLAIYSTRTGLSIQTYPFFWLAKMVARIALWDATVQHASITKGRYDIIWRNS